MWKKYWRIETVEARPYVPGESLTNIFVSYGPEEGGMIVRDGNGVERYVGKEFFEEEIYVPYVEFTSPRIEVF